MQLIPLGNGENRSTAQFTPISQGLFMGVHITLRFNALENILESIEAWYENRDEVILVDSGVSSKQSVGYIILEFEECEPDQLLLSIFDHEDVVLDYVIYTRESEV